MEGIHKEFIYSKQISNVEDFFAQALLFIFFASPYSSVSYSLFHGGYPTIVFI
jgi:hypothetical protein